MGVGLEVRGNPLLQAVVAQVQGQGQGSASPSSARVTSARVTSISPTNGLGSPTAATRSPPGVASPPHGLSGAPRDALSPRGDAAEFAAGTGAQPVEEEWVVPTRRPVKAKTEQATALASVASLVQMVR